MRVVNKLAIVILIFKIIIIKGSIKQTRSSKPNCEKGPNHLNNSPNFCIVTTPVSFSSAILLITIIVLN